MIILYISVFIIIIAFLLFILVFSKTDKSDKMDFVTNIIVAHRGVYNNIDIPENSIKAFELAKEYNYPVELDVQLTKDNVLVVFHDDSLLRMCGLNKKINDSTYDEIKNLKLINTDYTIPTFKEVLDLIADNIPICVEIKYHGDYLKTTRKSLNLLKKYNNYKFTVQSFQPKVLLWLKKKHPEIIRGQLASNFIKSNNKVIKFLSPSLLLCNLFTRPDYVAFNFDQRNNIFFILANKVFKIKTQVWTIKNQNDFDKYKTEYDMVLFDKFNPNS